LIDALIAVRLAHFVATLLLFGSSAYLWLLAPAGLARQLAGRMRVVAAACIVVAATSALAWFALEAGLLGEGWSDVVNIDVLADLLWGTSFGVLWAWRLGLVVILVGALALGRQDRWAHIAPVSALLLASLGLTGHARLQAGAIGALHQANHAVHLLAAGAWFGGLAPFILSLRRFEDASLRAAAVVALKRFSSWGQFVVALIVATGAVNTALTLGAAPLDLASPYQALLAAKIALVTAMIATAMFNRYRLAPWIAGDDAALARLRANSVGEVGLGFAVLALVSVLGVMEPV